MEYKEILTIKWRRLPPEVLAAAVSRYAKGAPARECASALNISIATVLRAARRCGISTARTSRRIPLNQNAFSVMTEHAAYWVGFLMADGNISSHRPVVTLALSSRDEGHVRKFREFLSSAHKIITTPPRQYEGRNNGERKGITIQSDILVKALAQYGVIPRKSLIARFGGGLENNPHAWRGMIDGDGSITVMRREYGTYGVLSLCGGADILAQYQSFVRSLYPCRATVHRVAGKNIYEVKISGGAAATVLQALYGSATVSLDRKHAAAMQVIELSTHHQWRRSMLPAS